MSIFFKSKKHQKTWYGTTWDYVESLGIALIMALMIKTSVVEAYKIPSGSMENTLLVGDFLLANKFIYGMRLPIPYIDIKLPAITDPKPGDIVIFRHLEQNKPAVNYIKRCIAIEGQTIEIKNKEVYVDGKLIPLPEHGKHEDAANKIPYNPGVQWGKRDNMPPTKVPPGKLFMMGDNRDNSYDSRYWGFLDRKEVLGRALLIHWSLDSESNPPIIRKNDMLSLAKRIGFWIIHLPGRLRYERLGQIIV
jgi:signal peptidase I